MSSVNQRSIFYIAGALVVYTAVTGNLEKMVVIPLIGGCLKKAGCYYKSQLVSQLGESVIEGSFSSLPAALVSYGLSRFLGESLLDKAVACIGGPALTYQAYISGVDFLVDRYRRH